MFSKGTFQQIGLRSPLLYGNLNQNGPPEGSVRIGVRKLQNYSGGKMTTTRYIEQKEKVCNMRSILYNTRHAASSSLHCYVPKKAYKHPVELSFHLCIPMKISRMETALTK